MTQSHNAQFSSNEVKINLTISSIKQREIQNVRRVVTTYNISRTIMFRRRIGISSRQECEVNSKKIIKLEEKIIVEHILELNSQEFSFTYSIARDMTNKLLAKRQISPIGKNWPNNFVARTSTLKTRMNRSYDYKRAMCEDSEIIDK